MILGQFLGFLKDYFYCLYVFFVLEEANFVKEGRGKYMIIDLLG